MEQATSISSSSREPAREPEETGMEQVLADLQALKGLYGLLHRGPQPNENLNEASRDLLMKMLDNATQQTLLRQAKLLSGPLMSPALERKLSIQPGRRTSGNAEHRLKPIASPSPSVCASQMSRRLKPQASVRSRDARSVYDDHRRRERDGRLLARVDSGRSSRTAMPQLHQRTPEQRLSRLASNRSSRVAEPRLHPSTRPEQHLSRVASNRSSRVAEPHGSVRALGRSSTFPASPPTVRPGSPSHGSVRALRSSAFPASPPTVRPGSPSHGAVCREVALRAPTVATGIAGCAGALDAVIVRRRRRRLRQSGAAGAAPCPARRRRMVAPRCEERERMAPRRVVTAGGRTLGCPWA
uniref:Uncharacterized protein n=1 Tax=Aegilops tauschii subsp. strangulata TaxID=200361 RepID=A0A453CUG2_AEGTS